MKMAFLLIAVGIVCLIVGIALYVCTPQTNEKTPNNMVNIKEVNVEPSSMATAQSDTTSVNNEGKEDCYEKGVEFEEYVVSRFSKKYFSLQEWRSDKYSKGVYAASNTYPDMEYTFTLRGESYKFAVECKWRSKYNKGNKLKWSYKEQLERYRQFAEEKNMPVFIILGIGGTPASPAEIFVVPLASINQVELSKSWLKNYRHDISKTMFFDVPTQTLR